MKKLTCLTLLLFSLGAFHIASAQPCSAAFNYTIGANKTVGFYAFDSSGLAHTWIFGDGTYTANAGVSITHSYAQPGTYTVVHAVLRASNGCIDSLIKTITIPADSCSMIASFRYSKDSLDCKKVHLINYSTSSVANAHYSWSFGDGTSSSDINPVHTYAQAGTYLVSLVSEAGANCRKQFRDTVYVSCGDTCAYTPYFSWRADSLAAGKVYFNNLTQPQPAGIHYTWNFGDSSAQSHDVSPGHLYAHPGNYYVCLVAELGSHCRKQYCGTVQLQAQQQNPCTVKAVFSQHRQAWVPLTTRFEAVSQGDSAAYRWYFSDSSAPASGRIISHQFPKTGMYVVCLSVTKGNCSAGSCQSVFVNDSTLNAPGLVTAIPNPAINSVTINVTLDRPETVIIRILDGNGVTRLEFAKTGTTGNNRFTLPVERLSPGIYLMEIHTGTRRWFSRFQKG